MTFSKEVKQELCKLENKRSCCDQSQLYSMLLFSRTFPKDKQVFATQSSTVANFFAQQIASLTGAFTMTEVDFRRTREESPRYLVCVEDENQRHLLSDRFSLELPGLDPNLLLKDCCVGAFFRGLFLLYGSMINPEREYHLELGAPSERLCEEVYLLGKSRNLNFKMTKRKGEPLLYLKESEQIEDFLTLIGAAKLTLKLMDIKIMKDMRNKVNRTTNCETANLGKTVAASGTQVVDISYILSRRGIEYLDEELRELALLRVENPECSLQELARMLTAPISRSGVNHRLKRISEAADRLRETPEL